MKRGPLFLAAALVEVLRFFILMTLAAALGLLADRPLIPDFVRYVSVVQLLFAAAYFFLWFDHDRYREYRPLALVGKFVSILAYAPLALSLIGYAGGEGFVPAGRLSAVASAGIPAVDLAGIFLLVLYRRTPSRATPQAAVVAQRGPEDIEKVEELP